MSTNRFGKELKEYNYTKRSLQNLIMQKSLQKWRDFNKTFNKRHQIQLQIL